MANLVRGLGLLLALGIFSSVPTGLMADQLTDRFEAAKTLAEQGEADAMYNLGQMYELGMGVADDRKKAYEWYQKAAEKDHPDAAYQMGYAFYWGKAGRKKDRSRAFQWFQQAAEQGNRAAMPYLSKMLALGQGVAQDKAMAEVWADRATQTEAPITAAPPNAAEPAPVAVEPEPEPTTIAEPTSAQAAPDDTAAKQAASPPPEPEPVVVDKPKKAPPPAAKPKRQVAKKKPRPAAAKISTRDRLLSGWWTKGSRPALFLPSAFSSCNKVVDELHCVSQPLTGHQYGTPYRYRLTSQLNGFTSKGRFTLEYAAELVEVLKAAAGYSADEGEEGSGPKADANSIRTELAKRRARLSCEFTGQDALECLAEDGKRQRFKRTGGSAAVQAAGAVALHGMTQQHHADRGHRQGQQNAEKTVQLTAGHDGEDHRNRVQADPVAHQLGSQQHTLDQLTDDKHQRDPGKGVEILKLQNGRHAGHQNTENQTQVGDEAHQAGEHADQQRQVQAGQPQAGGIDHRQGEHDQNLAAQESTENFIRFSGKPTAGFRR